MAVNPLYENTARHIFKLNLQSAADPDSNLNIEEITIADINKMLEVMYVNHRGLLQRFNRGDRCFAVLDKGRIISYFWAQFGVRDLCELHLKFNLQDNQTWMYNAITVKSARGRNLYPNVIRYMAKTLIHSGIDEAFVDVEPENRSSIRGLEKAGYKLVATTEMKKLLSKVRYKVTVFDKSAWLQLSQIIEDFNNIQCSVEDNIY